MGPAAAAGSRVRRSTTTTELRGRLAVGAPALLAYASAIARAGGVGEAQVVLVHRFGGSGEPVELRGEVARGVGETMQLVRVGALVEPVGAGARLGKQHVEAFDARRAATTRPAAADCGQVELRECALDVRRRRRLVAGVLLQDPGERCSRGGVPVRLADRREHPARRFAHHRGQVPVGEDRVGGPGAVDELARAAVAEREPIARVGREGRMGGAVQVPVANFGEGAANGDEGVQPAVDDLFELEEPLLLVSGEPSPVLAGAGVTARGRFLVSLAGCATLRRVRVPVSAGAAGAGFSRMAAGVMVPGRVPGRADGYVWLRSPAQKSSSLAVSHALAITSRSVRSSSTSRLWSLSCWWIATGWLGSFSCAHTSSPSRIR